MPGKTEIVLSGPWLCKRWLIGGILLINVKEGERVYICMQRPGVAFQLVLCLC